MRDGLRKLALGHPEDSRIHFWSSQSEELLDDMDHDQVILITAQDLKDLIYEAKNQVPKGMVEVRTFVPEAIAEQIKSGQIIGYSMGGYVRKDS